MGKAYGKYLRPRIVLLLHPGHGQGQNDHHFTPDHAACVWNVVARSTDSVRMMGRLENITDMPIMLTARIQGLLTPSKACVLAKVHFVGMVQPIIDSLDP